jgi:hypothetical protein
MQMPVRPSLYLFGALAAIATSCATPEVHALEPRYAGLPDKELWFSMRLVGAFNELRCQGLDPEEAKAAYEKRFGAKERAIDAAMLAKYGPLKEDEGVFLPIGEKCPAYRGAISLSERIRAELARRLGLSDRPAH